MIQLAAGALGGVLAMSTLIAAGVVQAAPGPPPPPANLVVTGCMGDGPAIGVAKPGDQLWVTGRSADGAYLRVHVPGPIGEGWVLADHVTLLAGDPIPVAACVQVAGATGTPGPTAVPASPTPTATATATATAKATAKPTAKPTQAQPTATPKAKPTATPNVGPVFTLNPPQATPTKIGTNPLRTGNCGTSGVSAQVKTAATDPDGLASMQLWVQRPGSSSFVLLSHGFSRDGSFWYASIDTAKDKIVDEGTLSYRAVAIDGKGVASTSKAGSLEIFRCDTEAVFTGGVNASLAPYSSFYKAYVLNCNLKFSIPFKYTITDPDGLSSVTLTYTVTSITDPNHSKVSDKITLRLGSNNVWRGATKVPSTGSFAGFSTVTWFVRSSDIYGGTSRDPKYLFSQRSAKVYWDPTCGVD